ncbi:MAG: C10 family peptidase [Bacteroidales bacterium]|nr:C10 family peptidase [Bacteroidales bacterium]
MKKLLLILCLLCPLLAVAAPVSETACRKIAAEFLNSKKCRADVAQLKLVKTDFAVKSSAQAPAYYVYKTPAKGFVIVSGDDSVEPILAYSTEGNLSEGNPAPNFLSWMQMWERIIDSNRRLRTKADSKVSQAWMDVTAPAKMTSGPAEMLLETALWNQGSPYNLKCPSDGGGRCYTGCTATALAIIMRYHKWPDAGVGTLPGYITGEIEIPDVVLGERYDWDNMPLTYDGTATEDQKNAVATLMYHLGVMMKSSYSSSGTGSHAIYIANSITKHMKYEDTQVFTYADLYSQEEWVENIKRSIQNNCPVHYSGWAEDGGGHAFVADGYDAQDKIHINFGWGGADNGYFAVPKFGEYTEGHIAIFNLKKDEGASSANIVLTTYKGSKGIEATVDGNKVTVFETGLPMQIKVAYYENLSAAAFDGELGVGHWNREGSLVEVLGSKQLDEEFSGLTPDGGSYLVGLDFSGCVLEEPIRVGDVIMAMFKEDGGEWKSCPYERNVPGFVGALEIADPRTIRECTKVSMDPSAGTVVITTKDQVEIKLLDSAGAQVADGFSITDTGAVIDAARIRKGKYTLSLFKENEELVEIEVEL